MDLQFVKTEAKGPTICYIRFREIVYRWQIVPKEYKVVEQNTSPSHDGNYQEVDECSWL